MLAVYVHKDNPIKGLTLPAGRRDLLEDPQGRLRRATSRTWGELGLTGEWADKPISLYGRNSASGTYGYFKEHALFKGDYKDSVKEQPGSSSVVQGVASDKYGIGYSGIGYKTADVRAVPLAAKRRRAVRRGHAGERLHRRVPARALPLPLRQLQARAASSIRCAASS